MGEESLETIEEGGKIGVFFSPEGVMMMINAALFDFLDLLIGSFLLIDLFAILIIGGWMFLRRGEMKITEKAGIRITKTLHWGRRLKWLRPLLIFIEFIPIVGILPLWILVVYFELKYS